MDRNRRIAFGAAAVVVLVAGAVLVPKVLDDDGGKDDDGAVNGGPAGTVVADDRAYSPASLTVDEAKDVRFRNDDDVAHTFTADDGLFDSKTVAPGGEFRFSFDGPRRVRFHCEIHPTMKGTIVVEG